MQTELPATGMGVGFLRANSPTQNPELYFYELQLPSIKYVLKKTTDFLVLTKNFIVIIETTVNHFT